MKKQIVQIIILFWCAPIYLSGQSLFGGTETNITVPQIKVGITAGYNHANAEEFYDTGFIINSLPAFNAGLSTEFHLIHRFSLEPSILVNQKGFIIDHPDFEPSKYQLNYLSLHLQGKIYLTDYFKILLGSEASFLSNTTSNFPLFSLTYTNKADYSLFAGIEINLFKNLALHAKYNHSLSYAFDFNTTDVTTGDVVKTLYVKNRMFMFGFTYYPFNREINW